MGCPSVFPVLRSRALRHSNTPIGPFTSKKIHYRYRIEFAVENILRPGQFGLIQLRRHGPPRSIPFKDFPASKPWQILLQLSTTVNTLNRSLLKSAS